MLDQFLCCCVNTSTNAEQVGVNAGSDLLTGTTGSDETAFPLESSKPRFLLEKQDHAAKAVRENPPSLGDINGSSLAMNTDRSTASAGSSMSPEEKEREKARLQRMVKDFAKEAVTGIAVSLVSPETARQSPHFFQMDRYLTVFSLKPKDGVGAEALVQDFNVKDLAHIYKGGEVSIKAPSLGGVAVSCVGLDTNRADRRLFFHFDDHYERDKFYTCLKILRMSVDVHRSA
mmetsp:Transcript_33296/g.72678  ORF Transcript_33296/g.72678 Transcript_33296/m.72678 type:complete len:231 (-) Transcript_33296:277-969(-)